MGNFILIGIPQLRKCIVRVSPNIIRGASRYLYGALAEIIIWGPRQIYGESSYSLGSPSYKNILCLSPQSHRMLPRSMTHYSDVIMGAMASQISSPTIVYSTVNPLAALLVLCHVCAGNSPITSLWGTSLVIQMGEFPARTWQRTSNTGTVFIWWRHHEF